MAGKLRIPRMRGAVTGMLLVLLDAWGAVPRSRRPAGAAILRRVVAGPARATAGSAGHPDSAEPAKTRS